MKWISLFIMIGLFSSCLTAKESDKSKMHKLKATKITGKLKKPGLGFPDDAPYPNVDVAEIFPKNFDGQIQELDESVWQKND